jgi:hypothetical protein
MAKKTTQELEQELQNLKKQEQSFETIKSIAELEAEIEKKKKAAERFKPKETHERPSQFSTYEEWRLEKKIANSKEGSALSFKHLKEKPEKTVRLLKEHADTLNGQKENTLVEYIEKTE